MRKQGVILVIATLMALILCGAVSATDSSTTGGEGNISDVNASEPVDPILWVNVGYEYADDNITPEIAVTDSNNDSVAFDKTKYSDTLYKLNFTYAGVANGTLFNVMLRAPGYKNQTQQVAVTQAGSDPEFVGFATFNMQATENYKLGREVTAKANQTLNFNTADEILCITTAGIPQINGTTTEDVLEGILNGSNGLITYGQGNLITLRKTQEDPVDIAFIIRKGTALTAVFFKNGSLTPSFTGTFDDTMSQDYYTNVIVPAFGSDAYPYVSLANAWAIGLSSDILREAAFHGHVCLGTISGYAMIQTLLKYYPPGSLSGGAESTSYLCIGVPGNSDDDVFVYSMDDTPGKRAYIGSVTNDTSMTGFIRWNSKANNGTLVIMKFDEQAVTQQFKNDLVANPNGIAAYSGISAELKFNKWLVEKLQTDPESLVTILYAFDNLTEEQCIYLNGGTGSNTEGDAHGLDMDYILSQTNLVPAQTANMNYVQGSLTAAEMKGIGTSAYELAKQCFANDLGIDLDQYKDYSNLVVLTSAGYVRLQGQSTEMAWDGIYDALGTRLSRATLLPVHSAMWGDLWFTFVLKTDAQGIAGKKGSFGKFSFTMDENDSFLLAVYMRYDPVTKQFILSNDSSGQTIHDIGPACNQTKVSKLFGNWNGIDTITNAWSYDPPFDMLMVYLFHNHVCPGVSPSGILTDYIFEQYPLGENEKYIYVTTNDYCDADGLLYLLGISPGAGTYLNQRRDDNTVDGKRAEGYLIIWDDKTQTGKVMIITYSGPKFASNTNQLKGYISLYKGETPDNLVQAPQVESLYTRLINSSERNMLLSGQAQAAYGSPFAYIQGIPADRTLADLVPVQGGSETGGSTSQGTSTGSGLVTSTGTGGTGRFFSGSVGDSGANVNAATETTATTAGAQPGDSGKSYEVTKAGTQKSDDTPWGTYAVVGIMSVLALAGIGFFFKGSLFGR